MKKLFSIVFILQCCMLWSQDMYYKSNDGKIVNQVMYDSMIVYVTDAAKSVSKSTVVKTNLTELYKKKDSIVMGYNFEMIVDGNNLSPQVDGVGQNYTTILEGMMTMEGRKINRDDLIGKPTLLNFWFIKCKPCIEEMPALNRLKEKYGDRMNFIAVTFEKEEDVAKFLKKHNYDFEQVVNSRTIIDQLAISSYPTNIFMNEMGDVVEVEGGLPYTKKGNGPMKMDDGTHFESIIKKILK